MANLGGYRPGAGRPKGSKNKATIAKAAVAEILNVDDADQLHSAIHRRGHKLLLELDNIALDPTQPVAARIIAAKAALPFLLPRKVEVGSACGSFSGEDLVQRLNAGRARYALAHSEDELDMRREWAS